MTEQISSTNTNNEKKACSEAVQTQKQLTFSTKVSKVLLSSTLGFLCYSASFYHDMKTKKSPNINLETNFRGMVVQSPYKNDIIIESTSRRLESLGISSKDPKAPALAWLMSFPDSGATYVGLAIQGATHRSIASNYGNSFMHPNGEVIHDQYASLPIFNDRPNGPYLFSELPLPDKYVLSKTQCGGHCTDCYPGRYLKGPNQFKEECLTSARFDPEMARTHPGEDPFHYQTYDPRLVQKAIHLVRDPFDNIISRFNHEYKLANAKGNTAFTKAYQFNSGGFHKWCDYLASKFRGEEGKVYDKWNAHLTESVYEKSINVPCHAEFYKYVQWHNNAFYVTDDAMELDTMMLHYEDFQNLKDEAFRRIADFLEVDIVNEKMDFHYHTYDYFTLEERKLIMEYIRLLANPTTWQSVARYFSDVAE